MATDTTRNYVVMFGGGVASAGSTEPTDETWIWNGIWEQPTLNNAPARYQAAMAFDTATTETVVFGGIGFNGNLSDTWAWDGHFWNQKQPQNHPSARFDSSMAYDPVTQRIVLFGGNTGAGVNNETWIWNGTDWTLIMTAGPSARSGHRLVYDAPRNQILLFGGTNGVTQLNDTWAFNTANLTWTQLNPTNKPGPRSDFGMVYTPVRQTVIVFGGTGNNGFLSDTWEWNGSSWNQIVPTGSSPSARYFPNMAYDPTSLGIVLFGGIPVQGPISNETWVLTGSTWSLVPVRPTPSARQAAAMAYDAARQNTVLYGGDDVNGTTQQDTWIWDGTAWTMKNPTRNPGPRVFAQAAFDPAQNVVLLWGGFGTNGTPSTDTWLWDGTNWTQINPANFPPPRIRFGMAYDPVRRSVIIFGGNALNTAGVLNDMWEWTGTNWNQIMPASVPQARSGDGLASDTARNRVVLFGGQNANGDDLNDTWEWDGVNWKNVTPANPASSPRVNDRFGIAYDSSRHQVIIASGEFYRVPSTYAWNGSVWTVVPVQRDLPQRTDYPMVYDSARRQIVVFGGFNGGLILGDTWVLPSSVNRGDFDGNAVPDVALQFPDGSMGVWYLTAASRYLSISSFAFMAGPSTGITLRNVADLNGDGIPDLILQFPDGSMGVWYMGPLGQSIQGFAFIHGPIQGWVPVGVADFDGDGHPDLVIQYQDGTPAVWYLGGSGGNQVEGFAPLYGPMTGWKVVGAADLNGDGHPDVILQYSDGSVGVWFMTGAQGSQISGFTLIAGPSTWAVVGLADMDGDGYPDLMIRNKSDGELGVWYLGGAQGSQITGFAQLTIPGHIDWVEMAAH